MFETNSPSHFDLAILKNRDTELVRKKARNESRWVLAPEKKLAKKTTSEFGFELRIEKDVLVFLDKDNGIIRVKISAKEDDLLHATGGIFNPKKGPETIDGLKDILQYISHKTGKKIIYRTHRANQTESLTKLLILKGFKASSGEFDFFCNPTKESNNSYPEIDSELNRLGLLN